MDKVRLAARLVGLSRAAARPVTKAERRAVAAGMVLLAKQLMGIDITKELDEAAKETGKLATQFKDAHADLIKEINDMEKALKDKQDVLKAYYKDWATKSGYKLVRAELLAQATKCMAIGETLDAVADGMKVARRESAQESWKEKYAVLVAMLNPAELAKYSRLLNLYYNKLITEFKTGLEMLDEDIKDWQQEAKDIAAEKGIKLTRASDRTAGFGDVVDALRDAISGLVRRVGDFFSGLLDRVSRHGQDLDDIEMKVQRILAEAQAKGDI